MNVAIIGMGFVGLSLAVVLASKKVIVYGLENNRPKLNQLKSGNPPFYETDLKKWLSKATKSGKLKFFETINEVYPKTDIIFITVGTPTKNGIINLNYIKSVSKDLGKLLRSSHKPLIVVKSTIVPGTTDNIIKPILEKYSKKKCGKDFFLVTNPEFLREGSAIKDQLNPHIIVTGNSDKTSQKFLKKFYDKIFPSKIPRVYVNFATSEMIKYANNAFLATKISFINTISNLCQKIPNTNIDTVAKCIGMDPRIGPLFLKAGPGYGGSCLPKDIDSLISVFQSKGVNSLLLRSVKEVNIRQLDEIVKLMKSKMKNLSNKTVSILGLSFKENSDDIRQSASIRLIKKLLKTGCTIKVHDPSALVNTKQIFNSKIQYCNQPKDCLRQSHCAVIMTAWPQYSTLGKKEFSKMKTPLVIDTRRILAYSHLDIDYNAIGFTTTNR